MAANPEVLDLQVSVVFVLDGAILQATIDGPIFLRCVGAAFGGICTVLPVVDFHVYHR
jgi:hypothetical protein